MFSICILILLEMSLHEMQHPARVVKFLNIEETFRNLIDHPQAPSSLRRPYQACRPHRPQ
jgi:hypothetical protein